MKQAVLAFVKKYGLLGFMTAIPTTPNFIDYDAVYMLKNLCRAVRVACYAVQGLGVYACVGVSVL